MDSSASRRRFLKRVGGQLSCLMATGCGTVLYPERRGQPAGAIDWKIVALDAVGLIFFFVPGVIAFAVDFTTGAIYLPPEHCTDATERRDDRELAEFHVPVEQLTPPGIAAAVSARIAEPVLLEPGRYQTYVLTDLEEFRGRQAACRLES